MIKQPNILNSTSIQLTPIGVINTPIHEKSKAPIQACRSDYEGIVEVFPQYAEGLTGIDDFSNVFLFYQFHKIDKKFSLMVKPFLDDKEHGIFATRYPVRPNSIGFSVVKLIKHEGNYLHVKGVDILDGTPLLDIKPYVPEFDVFSPSKVGWYKTRKYL